MGISSLHAQSDFFLGGIQVNEPDHADWTNSLKKAEMNTVSLTVYAKQGAWNSDNLWWEEQEEGVMAELKAAKKSGLKTVLILRVALDHAFKENKFLWHGLIMPQSDTLLSSWFLKYQRFVEKWAKIAKEYQIDVLAIGSEMRQLAKTQPRKKVPTLENYYLDRLQQKRYRAEKLTFKDRIEGKDLWVRGFSNYPDLESYLLDEHNALSAWAAEVSFKGKLNRMDLINQRRALLTQKWQEVIQVARQQYKGRLTYAANFDNYQNVAFWNELDLMGINAYFPLREPGSTKEPYTEMKKSWDRVFDEIETFQKKEALEGKKVMFTELGYIYRSNCSRAPWAGFGFTTFRRLEKIYLYVWGEEAYNLRERSLAVDALQEAAIQRKLLKGVLYWKLSSKTYHKDVEPFVLILGDNDPLESSLKNLLLIE